MTIPNSEISLYVDSLIVETLLVDESIIKNAQGSVITQLIEKVKSYFSAHIDPNDNDKVSKFLNIIAPGAIGVLLRSFGFGWIGWLFALALDVFHIDVSGILKSIYQKIKGLLSSGQTTSDKVDAAVQESVADANKPATEKEQAEAEAKLKQQESEALPKISMQLREAKLVKIAMKDYHDYKTGRIKRAGFGDYALRKNKVASILAKVLGWLFKVALASAGLLVAGDIVNKFVGRPNALDGTIQNGKPINIEPKEDVQVSKPVHRAMQTKFPLKAGYVEESYNVGNSYWDVKRMANEDSINQLLLEFAKQVYSGLDSLDAIILSTLSFQELSDEIAYVNRNNFGTNIIIIPRQFHSKKQLVDTFIDDVAKKVR